MFAARTNCPKSLAKYLTMVLHHTSPCILQALSTQRCWMPAGGCVALISRCERDACVPCVVEHAQWCQMLFRRCSTLLMAGCSLLTASKRRVLPGNRPLGCRRVRRILHKRPEEQHAATGAERRAAAAAVGHPHRADGRAVADLMTCRALF